MKTRVKAGTGFSRHHINYEERFVEIDLSGDYEGVCYRNDASVFFFVANSYKEAFFLIGKEIEIRFANEARQKKIEHLMLPYCFNFRHYVELELKALFVALEKKPPMKVHNLNKLLDATYKAIENAQVNDETIFTKDARECKNKAIYSMEIIREKLSSHLDNEPAADFYRYVFDGDMSKLSINETTIRLDFTETKEMFIEIMKEFNSIRVNLSVAGIYIYEF